MIGLIVTGHGNFATGLTSSLKLIAGDSPFKTAVTIGYPKGNVEVLAGTNLPMMIEVNMARKFIEELPALTEMAMNTGKDQVVRYEFKPVEQDIPEDGI